MILDNVGNPVFDSLDVFKEIYKGNLSKIKDCKIHYAKDIDYLSYVEFVTENNLTDWPLPEPYFDSNTDIKKFDKINQDSWYMPDEYKNIDIKNYIISLCDTSAEVERVEFELKLFEEHNMLTLLKFLKYLVDTLRHNNILWGVGRGSSVASYSLYLMGVHKVDSIKYDLDIREFLR